MEPRRTAVQQPVAIRIADDLRLRIEDGRLRVGDALPTLQDLMAEYRCSSTSARSAIAMLKQQGLITGGRGKPPVVRGTPIQIVRKDTRHQSEKDLVLAPEEVRAAQGLTESDLGANFEEFSFEAKYSEVPADQDLADAFQVQPGTSLLRREFSHRSKKTGALAAWSVSWLPADIIRANPAISDPLNKAWPGGTMHQLYTVGVEVDRVIEHVTAAMPSTADAQVWALAEGVPMLWVRRISLDTTDRVVEVTDAPFPADRTLLTFHTQLTRWEDK